MFFDIINEMDKEGLDYIGIFNEFNKNDIEYIVCGGVALNLLGIPRMTYDIDILLKMTPENVKKYCRLLKKWGFKPKIPVDIMDFAEKEKRDVWVKEKNMKAFNLYNENWAISEIDVLIDSPVNYESAIKKAIYKEVKGIKIPVISPEDLIEMKKYTKRKQDEADIRYLKKLYGKRI